jgi:hypothetical protein
MPAGLGSGAEVLSARRGAPGDLCWQRRPPHAVVNAPLPLILEERCCQGLPGCDARILGIEPGTQPNCTDSQHMQGSSVLPHRRAADVIVNPATRSTSNENKWPHAKADMFFPPVKWLPWCALQSNIRGSQQEHGRTAPEFPLLSLLCQRNEPCAQAHPCDVMDEGQQQAHLSLILLWPDPAVQHPAQPRFDCVEHTGECSLSPWMGNLVVMVC